MYDVAITGIGIVSSIGIGTREVVNSLCNGKSGIQFDPQRLELGFRGALTGVIKNYQMPELSRKKRKTMTEFTLHAYTAVLEAIEMSGLSQEEIASERTGLIIGNDSSTLANVSQVDITREQKSTLPIGTSKVFQALNSTTTMNLNTLLGNKGASWTISGACSSGGHAIGQACDLIALGRQDRVICGGVQEINWESVCSFDATNAFSIRHDQPERASRPFDADRDGLVPSGGAAMVILEQYDMAKKRGANILGRVRAYAFSSDGSDLAVPSGEGLERCMRECLNRGTVRPDQVDYISAHGTSTPVGDAAEAQAIYNLFGSKSPWVSSIKSMTGHEMWMSGASQVVYGTLMAEKRFIAPNINFKKQEPTAAKINIAAQAIETKLKYILLNSAGFGGTNSCLLLEV
ncbi:MAG: beta-ketoacyl-[acyl-carrier-protein] synthase family protein [Calditrichaceae bacterium]|nr:beta-ketoacyl-[acyl-carrier-protein] synthase family protein [Calditrichaceae bacterium]HES59241.1 beta-ketoacyl-[acyl-carrier-protein] synthase family protein [Caldithrix sp.]